MYSLLRMSSRGHIFNTTQPDAAGHALILMDTKIMVALKYWGCQTLGSAWLDYFQMGWTTAQIVVQVFCSVVSSSPTLRAKYLWSYSQSDAIHVVQMQCGKIHCFGPGKLWE